MNARTLLVSDDPETAQIWAYALGEMGLQAVVAGSAQEALDRWAEGVCDLILIDVHTPQLDGIDLCRRLRAEAVNPILLFTPTTDEAHLQEAYRAGVDECIVKPIDPSLFRAKVRAWLRRSWRAPAAEAGVSPG